MKKYTFHISLATIILVLLLNACGSAAKSTPTPTQESLDAISTAAAQTAFFQLTQLALTVVPTATNTETPVLTPTDTPVTTALSTRTLPPATSASCGDLTFVKDVTIPDGTAMVKGQEFTKTWRVTNSGTCTWSTSFKLAFLSGEQMGGKTASLADAVAVGDKVDLSVSLTVPDKTGKLTGWWVLLDDKGQRFGVALSVVINVGTETLTPTETLTATETLTPTVTKTPKPTKTPTPITPSKTPKP